MSRKTLYLKEAPKTSTVSEAEQIALECSDTPDDKVFLTGWTARLIEDRDHWQNTRRR